MSRKTYRVLACAAFASSLSACEFPFSPEKYQLAPDSEGQESAQRVALRAFTQEPTCVEQVQNACPQTLSECARIAGCAELATCIRERRTPAAEPGCASELDSSIDALRAYEALRACWAEQYGSCDVGSDFDCLEAYVKPGVRERSQLLLQEQFKYVGHDLNGATFTLLACGLGPDDCEPPLALATTDENGWASMSVSLNPGRAGQEWSGARRVSGDQIRESRIERNIPVWSDHVEVTRLADEGTLRLGRELLGISGDQAVLVQVLDCQSAPAARIELRASHGEVYYHQGLGFAKEGGTRGVGAADVLNAPADTPLTIDAIDQTGRIVASWLGRLAPHELVYLKLYPTPAPL